MKGKLEIVLVNVITYWYHLFITTATTIFIGSILLPNQQWARAIAISHDGNIIFIGNEEDTHHLIAENTKIIRLSDDQIIIPGFQVTDITINITIF